MSVVNYTISGYNLNIVKNVKSSCMSLTKYAHSQAVDKLCSQSLSIGIGNSIISSAITDKQARVSF